MITFENVAFYYRSDRPVLKNISLQINQGEQVALVGGNGSGKTTLALMINGILKPTSGKIMINGLNPVDENNHNKLKQKVGLVFQNPDNQLVSSTVEREVAFSLENLNVPRNEMQKQVDRELDFFGLMEHSKRLTSELSGGEKQRLALASVMVTEPDILILDEPGSFLDESGKRLLDSAIEKLVRDKPELTLIRITQFSRIAAKYERMIVINEGQVFLDDAPALIFSDNLVRQQTGIGRPFEFWIKDWNVNHPISDEFIEKPNRAKPDKTIALHSLSFGYGDKSDKKVIRDISLTIDNGSIYGLLGPSGSGKTTLIQIIGSLLKPQSGKIEYGGFLDSPGELAVVFQQSERQFFLETVDDEIRFGAENLSLPDIGSIADNCYDLIGLEKNLYSNRNPFNLSGGEKRRLAFGTILSLRPSFIFFDEPTCSLDHDGIFRFKRMVTKLKEEKVGIVIVSHFGDIIFDLCDKIISLKEGRIDYSGDASQFFSEMNYTDYLSIPEPISYQLKRFDEIRYLTARELLNNI